MKSMTKLITAILVVAMLFSLAACGSKNDDTASGSDVDAEDVETSGSDVETDNEDLPSTDTDLEDIEVTTVNDGVLTMTTEAGFPPYEFIENNEVVGIDVEIAAAIAEKLGLELKVEDMDFDGAITAAAEGKSDIAMAGISVTEERKEMVDFTPGYATGVQVVVVKEGSDITSVDDLFADDASYTIGVQRNTTGDIYCTGDLEEAGKATMDRYSKYGEAITALNTGKVDCVVMDMQPALAFVEEVDGLKVLETEYANEEYAIAMNKENAALYVAVCNALQELMEDGTVADIINKYIPAEAN